MKISLTYGGTLEHAAYAAQLAQRLAELEADLKAQGLKGTLAITDMEKYEAKNK